MTNNSFIILLIILWITVELTIFGFASVYGQLDYNQTCNQVQCYICGPLDENVCILGDKK